LEYELKQRVYPAAVQKSIAGAGLRDVVEKRNSYVPAGPKDQGTDDILVCSLKRNFSHLLF